MNEKIKELEARAKNRSQYLLAVLCNKTDRTTTEVTEQEKQELFNQTFAGLIIQECAEWVNDNVGLLDEEAADDLLKHFGVE